MLSIKIVFFLILLHKDRLKAENRNGRFFYKSRISVIRRPKPVYKYKLN